MTRAHTRAILFLLTVICPSVALSQSVDGYRVGYTDVGATIGVGGISTAGLAFGGRFEKAIKPLEEIGDGTLGIQLSVDWWNYSETFIGSDYDFTYIPIGLTANYHFQTEQKKIDPFVGLGLGYSIVSTSYTGTFSTGLYVIAKAGVRYFLNSKMAVYGDIGAGAATLNIGLMFTPTGAN